MSQNRLKFIVVAAAGIIFASTAMADLRIGITAEPYPPFSAKDAAGKWVGWEIDVMNAVCAKLKEKCEIVETAWDGIIPALTSKKIDVIMASMAITDERKKTIAFSTPYYSASVVMIAAKGHTGDLTGKVIGTQTSSIHARYVEKHYPDNERKSYATLDEATADLSAGRIDVVQAELSALQAFLETDAGKACCTMIGKVPPDPEVLGQGVGAGIRHDDEALKKRFDTALADLAAGGEFKTITASYPELSEKIIVPGE